MNTKQVGVLGIVFGVLCLGIAGTAIADIASDSSEIETESGHEFNVTTLDIPSVVEGEQLVATIGIANDGESAGEDEVELNVPGIGSNQTQVTLDSDESTTIELRIDTEIEDAAASPYTATATAGQSERSESVAVQLPVLGESHPQDLNGDGLYEDVTGNDRLDIADVQTLFDSFANDEIGAHAWAFNFAGFNPSEVTIFDVQALFREYQRAIPTFEVTLTDVPDEVDAGEDIEVGYVVENIDENAHTQDITFAVDGDQQAVTPDIELEPGDTFSDTFSYTTDADDVPEVSVSVASETDSETTTVTVAEVEPPTFAVELTDFPDEVIEGEDIDVEYEVENTGDQTDTQDIVFEIDGQEVDSDAVELEPGDTFSDTFTYTTDSDDVPEVVVTVSSETDSDTSSVTVTGADDFDIRGTLSNETADVGETVTIEYSVVSETGEEPAIAGYGLEIEYDSEILAFQSIGGGAFEEPFDFDHEDGQLAAIDSGNNEQTPLEPMVEIEFEVVGDGTSPISFVAGENEIFSPAPGSEVYNTRFVDGVAGTSEMIS